MVLNHSASGAQEYSLDYSESAEGGPTLWLNKISQVQTGQYSSTSKSQVIDELKLSEIRENEESSDYCKPSTVGWDEWNGKRPQNFIVAIATFHQSKRETRKIRRAWKINWEKLKFEEISAKGISCYREESNE
jgi:hypothetical protein